MCGIVGYISLNDKSHPLAKRHFSDYALMLDTLRGSDSTGIIRVGEEFDVHTAHTTMPGRRYVNTDEYDAFMSGDMWAMIGHNRAATAGSVKLENAHPFTFGEVTMVHNGTLAQQGRTVPGYDHKLEVDSMQIARALSQIEPDHKAVAELLEKIDGSFALVWVDRRDESINMCRNSSRPLHFGYGVDKDVMWFMSDGTHLKAVTGSLKNAPSKVNSIYSLDKMKLLKFKKGDMKPEVTPFKAFTRPTATYQQPSGGGTTTDKVGTALARAAHKWGEGIRQASSHVRGGTSSEGKCRIGGELRSIPDNHKKVLREYFELNPGQLLEFQPEEWIECEDKKCIVNGTFLHPNWMWTEWPCTLYDVPLVVCNAYGERNWAIHAKGVTSCQIAFHSDEVVALLGELYSFDAKAVIDTHTCDTSETTDMRDTGLVTGPEETLMERGKVMELLSRGCIQCQDDIKWEDRVHTVIVNEGRDLLCPGCATEWKNVPYYNGKKEA